MKVLPPCPPLLPSSPALKLPIVVLQYRLKYLIPQCISSPPLLELGPPRQWCIQIPVTSPPRQWCIQIPVTSPPRQWCIQIPVTSPPCSPPPQSIPCAPIALSPPTFLLKARSGRTPAPPLVSETPPTPTPRRWRTRSSCTRQVVSHSYTPGHHAPGRCLPPPPPYSPSPHTRSSCTRQVVSPCPRSHSSGSCG